MFYEAKPPDCRDGRAAELPATDSTSRPKSLAYSPEIRADIIYGPPWADSRNMQVKFKFKIVLTTVNYCVFCLFRFCKIVFNFKFKLILRKKKIYVNNFLANFQLPMTLGGRFGRPREISLQPRIPSPSTGEG
jgi:hypothetical protein